MEVYTYIIEIYFYHLGRIHSFARIAILFSNISIKSERTTCSNKIILSANKRQLEFLLIPRGLRAFIRRSRRSIGYLFSHKFYFLVGRLITHEGSISAAKNFCRHKTRGELEWYLYDTDTNLEGFVKRGSRKYYYITQGGW